MGGQGGVRLRLLQALADLWGGQDGVRLRLPQAGWRLISGRKRDKHGAYIRAKAGQGRCLYQGQRGAMTVLISGPKRGKDGAYIRAIAGHPRGLYQGDSGARTVLI